MKSNIAHCNKKFIRFPAGRDILDGMNGIDRI